MAADCCNPAGVDGEGLHETGPDRRDKDKACTREFFLEMSAFERRLEQMRQDGRLRGRAACFSSGGVNRGGANGRPGYGVRVNCDEPTHTNGCSEAHSSPGDFVCSSGFERGTKRQAKSSDNTLDDPAPPLFGTPSPSGQSMPQTFVSARASSADPKDSLNAGAFKDLGCRMRPRRATWAAPQRKEQGPALPRISSPAPSCPSTSFSSLSRQRSENSTCSDVPDGIVDVGYGAWRRRLFIDAEALAGAKTSPVAAGRAAARAAAVASVAWGPRQRACSPRSFRRRMCSDSFVEGEPCVPDTSRPAACCAATITTPASDTFTHAAPESARASADTDTCHEAAQSCHTSIFAPGLTEIPEPTAESSPPIIATGLYATGSARFTGFSNKAAPAGRSCSAASVAAEQSGLRWTRSGPLSARQVLSSNCSPQSFAEEFLLSARQSRTAGVASSSNSVHAKLRCAHADNPVPDDHKWKACAGSQPFFAAGRSRSADSCDVDKLVKDLQARGSELLVEKDAAAKAIMTENADLHGRLASVEADLERLTLSVDPMRRSYDAALKALRTESAAAARCHAEERERLQQQAQQSTSVAQKLRFAASRAESDADRLRRALSEERQRADTLERDLRRSSASGSGSGYRSAYGGRSSQRSAGSTGGFAGSSGFSGASGGGFTSGGGAGAGSANVSGGTQMDIDVLAPLIARVEVESLASADDETRSKLKKKLQLKWHPDKCVNAILATRVMQELQQLPEWK